ncbi:hypothetical protein lerEdw1_013411 [Lerista edwardsae]|nr:hypothetical protein lerEdw1_013414 [Lerista edwardsae]KAJ6650308.1 hypothetical protein lerEdw1_013411 [Lerista edwardsae]
MEAASQVDLEALKYSQLQRLAKAVGLKANLKADKLLNTLKQHFKEAAQKDGNMVNQRSTSSSSATDTEELNGSQIPINTALVTKRRRKRKGQEAQRNLEDVSINELLPEKETETVQEESWGFEDAGSGKTPNQNNGWDHGPAGSLAENLTTPSQLRERNSTRRKRVGDFTPVDSQSGKKCRYPGKTGIVPTTTPSKLLANCISFSSYK